MTNSTFVHDGGREGGKGTAVCQASDERLAAHADQFRFIAHRRDPGRERYWTPERIRAHFIRPGDDVELLVSLSCSGRELPVGARFDVVATGRAGEGTLRLRSEPEEPFDVRYDWLGGQISLGAKVVTCHLRWSSGDRPFVDGGEAFVRLTHAVLAQALATAAGRRDPLLHAADVVAAVLARVEHEPHHSIRIPPRPQATPERIAWYSNQLLGLALTAVLSLEGYVAALKRKVGTLGSAVDGGDPAAVAELLSGRSVRLAPRFRQAVVERFGCLGRPVAGAAVEHEVLAAWLRRGDPELRFDGDRQGLLESPYSAAVAARFLNEIIGTPSVQALLPPWRAELIAQRSQAAVAFTTGDIPLLEDGLKWDGRGRTGPLEQSRP